MALAAAPPLGRIATVGAVARLPVRRGLSLGAREAGSSRQTAFAARRPADRRASATAGVVVAAGTTSIQFIKGVNESSVPDVKLTRSRNGATGTALFVFSEPSVFDAGSTQVCPPPARLERSPSKAVPQMGDITGLFMTDEEGTMSTVDVTAKFVNGKPAAIEAKYVMRSSFEWDRFMRFMQRYAVDNNLGFNSNNKSA